MLRSALDWSTSAFEPLGEPLLIDMGLHRWLDQAREESYSDWLAWTLEQLGTAADVFYALGLVTHQALERCGHRSAVSSREIWVSEGHRQSNPGIEHPNAPRSFELLCLGGKG